MGDSTIHDLLPIPQGTRQPHAYQVLGLDPGEQDSSTIKSAISVTVARLKKAKATTDSKTWSRAAKLVQQASQILSDAEKKAELDARFGIVPVASRSASPPTPPAATTVDPLAAMLPSSDPLAAALPPTNPLASIVTEKSSMELPPPPTVSVVPRAGETSELPPASPGAIFGSPTLDPANRTDVPGTPALVAPVVLKDASRRVARRRRKSWLGSLLLALFSLTLLGLIALLGYFLVFGPGQVAISKSNRGLTITTGPVSPDRGLVINPPTGASQDPAGDPPAAQPRRRDNVMGRLAGDVPPPAIPPPGEPSETPPLADASANRPSPEIPSPEIPSPEMVVEDPDRPAAEPDTTTPAEPMEPAEPPAMAVPEGELTEEMIAAADQKMAEVADLLRAAKWKVMKPAAAALTEQPLTGAQRERAEALYEVADLASFYRGGIERGVESLVVGNDFAVTEAFRVIIVETGEDLLVIRFNAKNRSYTFDEFPFALAHKLASFSMPSESPTTQAAKAVYQAIAPKATPDHRQEAIEWLQAIDEEVEDADPQRIVATLQSLFADPG